MHSFELPFLCGVPLSRARPFSKLILQMGKIGAFFGGGKKVQKKQEEPPKKEPEKKKGGWPW